jgi:hypothetical protein
MYLDSDREYLLFIGLPKEDPIRWKAGTGMSMETL